MIIVDDRLCLEALAGRLDDLASGAVVATTWGFHYRLLRALADDVRVGRLTQSATGDLRRVAANPSPSRLIVLDPRELTERAAVLAARHHLNLLAAELVAAATAHSAAIALSSGNVGRSWPSVLAAEGIELKIL